MFYHITGNYWVDTCKYVNYQEYITRLKKNSYYCFLIYIKSLVKPDLENHTKNESFFQKVINYLEISLLLFFTTFIIRETWQM